MVQRIVLATGNKGKAREFEKMLTNTGIEIVLQSEFNVKPPVEDGTTFVENAIIKARHASFISGLPAIADDSGIEVDCLKGEPGVYSARYSGENATDEANLDLLLSNVAKFPASERSARYWCVLVLMRHYKDPTPIIFQRSWNGEIILDKRGQNGFGYDPSFYVPLLGMTAAEMEPELKNRISHRGQAMADMLPEIIKLYGNK